MYKCARICHEMSVGARLSRLSGFVQDAIASCPVDCIHWVEKDKLPALEYVMRNKVQVTDVGTMMGGAGHVADVFAAATQFLKKRDKE